MTRAAGRPDLRAATNAQMLGRIEQGGFTYFRQISTVLTTVTVAFALLLICVLLTVSVNQRLGEIAALRALGFSRRRVVADDGERRHEQRHAEPVPQGDPVALLADGEGVDVAGEPLGQLVADEAARIAQIEQGNTAAPWLAGALRAAGVLKDGESL